MDNTLSQEYASTGAHPVGGWIGWLATPLQDNSPHKKINTRKDERKYVDPKNIEMGAIVMHANAEPSTEVQLGNLWSCSLDE